MSAPWNRGPLRVSSNQRRLEHADGTNFFYLADTAWELFHRLTLDEVDEYLAWRNRLGFNAVQCVLLAEIDGLRTPNRNGDLPLVDLDPTRWNEPYWAHVDRVLDRIAAAGLYAAILPTWADKIDASRWGEGPEIFTPETMLAYAERVSFRMRFRPNIVWVVGGDRDPAGREDVYRAEAQGLRKHDPFRRLMTLHPCGGMSSSHSFHQEEWLDFNMLQTGHGSRHATVHDAIERDWSLEPPKPMLDGEPRYENHPPFDEMADGVHMDNDDSRRAAYASVFSGACGVTYGCHTVWQMHSDLNVPINRPLGGWRESMFLPGAQQYGILRRLMEELPFGDLLPAHELASCESDGDWMPVRALATPGHELVAVYTPHGRPVSVATSGTRRARWFNPRNGSKGGWFEFDRLATPPGGSGQGGDWVLLIEAA